MQYILIWRSTYNTKNSFTSCSMSMLKDEIVTSLYQNLFIIVQLILILILSIPLNSFLTISILQDYFISNDRHLTPIQWKPNQIWRDVQWHKIHQHSWFINVKVPSLNTRRMKVGGERQNNVGEHIKGRKGNDQNRILKAKGSIYDFS